MQLRIFTTGGTFDKEYDEIHGRLFFKDTQVPEMLRLGRCRLEVVITPLMMIDSLEMKQEDRERIRDAIGVCKEERVVVTHGTDTMVETAQVLAAGLTGRTVVLTGAMVPYKFGSSDGLFNLGSALSFAQVLPAGVYVAMNGMVFPHDQVRKNRSTGIFEMP